MCEQTINDLQIVLNNIDSRIEKNNTISSKELQYLISKNKDTTTY